jgi:hypothetical protein
MSKTKIYLDVLSRQQKELLPQLRFLKKERFYLAGGTALALQIGHRTSADFDFYSPNLFKSKALFKEFLENTKEVQKLQEAWGTLILKLGDVETSLFYYDYPLLKTPFGISAGINLSSIEDIAAMKIEAIIQRGTKRDFIDIYFLLQELNLKKILRLCQKKYAKVFNVYQALLALLYFEDAEQEGEEKRYKLLKDCSWEEIKFFIKEAVRQFKEEEVNE